MAMSDCIKCWNTPCTCGWEYRNLSINARIDRASVVLGIPPTNLQKILKGLVPRKHPMSEQNKD